MCSWKDDEGVFSEISRVYFCKEIVYFLMSKIKKLLNEAKGMI